MEDPVIRKDMFSQVLDTTIDRARNGDTESARKILEWFCGAIKANTDKSGRPYRKPSGIGTQIDERILRYVGECFKRILDGGPGARVDCRVQHLTKHVFTYNWIFHNYPYPKIFVFIDSTTLAVCPSLRCA